MLGRIGEFKTDQDAACYWIKKSRDKIENLVPKCEEKQLNNKTMQCKGENYWEECKAGRQFKKLNRSCEDCSKGM